MARCLHGEKKERKKEEKKKKINEVKKEEKKGKQKKIKNKITVLQRVILTWYLSMHFILFIYLFFAIYKANVCTGIVTFTLVNSINIFVKTLHLHETICLIFSLKIMIILIFPLLSLCEVVCLCIVLMYDMLP